MRTNRRIGTAIGILMATEMVTEPEASKLLRQASNHLNRKLVELAEPVHLTAACRDRRLVAERKGGRTP